MGSKFSFIVIFFLGISFSPAAVFSAEEIIGEDPDKQVKIEAEPEIKEEPEKEAVEKNQPAKIAILNFKAYNTSQTYADGVRDILEVNLYKTGVFHILEREQIDIILREHEIRDKWCAEQGCAVEIGRLLSTDKVIVGSITSTGNYSIAVKLVNIKTADVEHADFETAELDKDIPLATQRLAGRFAVDVERLYNGAETPAEETTEGSLQPAVIIEPAGSLKDEPDIYEKMIALWDHPARPYYTRGLVPGWGQLYAGKFYKGIVYAGLFSGAALYSCYALYDFRKKRDEYEDLNSGTNADFDRKHETAEGALDRANISLWIAGAVYAANLVDIIFFSRPTKIGESAALQIDNGISLSLIAAKERVDSRQMQVLALYEYRF